MSIPPPFELADLPAIVAARSRTLNLVCAIGYCCVVLTGPLAALRPNALAQDRFAAIETVVQPSAMRSWINNPSFQSTRHLWDENSIVLLYATDFNSHLVPQAGLFFYIMS